MILSVVVFCTIALSVKAQTATTQVPTTQAPTKRIFQLSFISPLGTNGMASHLVSNIVSFNLLGGYSYGNTAFEFGGLYNVNTHLTKGLQFAGIINYSGQSHNAVQVAGISNIAVKGWAGSQIGGIVNVAEDAFSQIGGVVNVAREVQGIQIGGVVNTAKQLKGMQIAGVINQTKQAEKTGQIAGIANVAAQGCVATQITGIFNSARRVKGVQIGLINYADSCDGVQIGLINIVKHEGKYEFEIAFSEALNTTVTFKLGSNKLYTIFSGGIKYINQPLEYAYGVGLGTHQHWGRNWGSQIEVVGYQLSEEGAFQGGLDLLGQFKFTVSKQIRKHFKVFAGPVFNMTISDYVNTETGKIGSSLAPYALWEQTKGRTNMKVWVGFSLGVRF